MYRKNAWHKYLNNTKPVMDFAEGYKDFISFGKTERLATKKAVELLRKAGYKEFDDEAIRLVKSFPHWVPAKQDCQDIPFKTVVTIPFDADKAKKN